jgi:hypothetical protein
VRGVSVGYRMTTTTAQELVERIAPLLDAHRDASEHDE